MTSATPRRTRCGARRAERCAPHPPLHLMFESTRVDRCTDDHAVVRGRPRASVLAKVDSRDLVTGFAHPVGDTSSELRRLAVPRAICDEYSCHGTHLP